MSDSRRLTGRGPARSKTKERWWRQQVARQRRGKLTVRKYCAQAGISEPSFYAWRGWHRLVRQHNLGRSTEVSRQSPLLRSPPLARRTSAAARTSG